MENLIYIDQNFGWFLGKFDNNKQHQHYALQLSMPVAGKLTIETKQKCFTTSLPMLIKPNVMHQLTSTDRHLLILFNPASTIGHFWHKACTDDVNEFYQSPATDLQKIVSRNNFQSKSAMMRQSINQLLKTYDCFCDAFLHQGDDRINQALAYLQRHYEKIVPLKEIADHCHISPGRFLHLFREQTGITYRRAQLWSKLVAALKLMPDHSLTTAAHVAGFSDSAHLSRTFRENFGFSPKELLKLSQFIQV